MMTKITLFWFRRDLRLDDNAGLYRALCAEHPVLPVFIFDRHILDKLEDRRDARVTFLHDTITALKAQLQALGSDLIVRYGRPEDVWPQLLHEYDVAAVYTNKDYEPYAHERDARVKALLADAGATLEAFKDHVIFEEKEVLSKTGGVYTVFSPYARTWKAKLAERMDTTPAADGTPVPISYYLKPYPNADYFGKLYQVDAASELPTLADMGFERSEIAIPDTQVSQGLIKQYDATRNFPALAGTSRLGIHFRFGTISIREKARKAQALNETFLNELIWRDFYAQILANFPHVASRSFRPEYDNIPWRNDEAQYRAWCEGRTGYPIVDAGMRELNATGHMHNRVRMITASFLTKHLLIDWRMGEAYFAAKLLDFDLASNNGGWQWAAGSGTDAAPYFRVFNPTSQMEKFDADLVYVRRWVPEYGTARYPAPIVDHKLARERCLETYKQALAR